MTLSAFLEPLAKRYDRLNMLGSIRAFPAQATQAIRESTAVKFPAAYANVDQVVIAGMGGSGLGAHVIQTTFADTLSVPLTIVNDYALPEFVDRKTLVIASSYSGATEETLAAYDDAKRRGAKLAVIAASGTLAARAKRDGVPAYIFQPTHNPSNQPRMAGGYLTFGTLGLLRSAGLLRIANSDIDRAIAWCTAVTERIERQAIVLDLARELVNRTPILIAAEHLVGATHVVQNQIHENAKHVAVSFPLPELDHHFMNALQFPVGNPKALHAIFFSTLTYHERTQRRVALTREVFTKQHIPTTDIAITGPNLLAESLTAISYGAYLAYTLALLHRMDPSPIPWVDWFKKRLTR